MKLRGILKSRALKPLAAARVQIESRLHENRKLMRTGSLDDDVFESAWMHRMLQRSVEKKRQILAQLDIMAAKG